MACIVAIVDILQVFKGTPKAPERSRKKISNESLDTNAKGRPYLRDITKPVGDACRDDGTLKDTDEMVWPNSPTELVVPQNDFHESHESYDDIMLQDGSDQNDEPSIRVSRVL